MHSWTDWWTDSPMNDWLRDSMIDKQTVPELSSSLRILSLTSSSHCCRICSASSLEQFSSLMLSIAKSLSPGSNVPVLRGGAEGVGEGGGGWGWDGCRFISTVSGWRLNLQTHTDSHIKTWSSSELFRKLWGALTLNPEGTCLWSADHLWMTSNYDHLRDDPLWPRVSNHLRVSDHLIYIIMLTAQKNDKEIQVRYLCAMLPFLMSEMMSGSPDFLLATEGDDITKSSSNRFFTFM